MKPHPLNDRVLVKRIEAESVTKSGIYIPENAKEKPLEGSVVAVGPGRLDDSGSRIPMEVKVGESVLIGKYAGTEVKIADEDHVIVREEDILAVMR